MPNLPVRVAALLFALPLSLCYAGKSTPPPCTLAVEVSYGSQKGAESFRDELELQLVRELQREGCLREVTVASGTEDKGTDLLLRVLVHDTEQSTDYDITIAQRDSPYRPATESMPVTARMEATVELQLRLLPEDRVVRERRLSSVEGFRPQLNEDAEYEVRLLMIRNLARRCSKFVCKGGVKKLRKEIALTRAAP